MVIARPASQGRLGRWIDLLRSSSVTATAITMTNRGSNGSRVWIFSCLELRIGACDGGTGR